MTEIIREFTAPASKRKRCYMCGQMVEVGQPAHLRLVVAEKYYPVKGTMKFQKWQSKHENC